MIPKATSSKAPPAIKRRLAVLRTKGAQAAKPPVVDTPPVAEPTIVPLAALTYGQAVRLRASDYWFGNVCPIAPVDGYLTAIFQGRFQAYGGMHFIKALLIGGGKCHPLITTLMSARYNPVIGMNGGLDITTIPATLLAGEELQAAKTAYTNWLLNPLARYGGGLAKQDMAFCSGADPELFVARANGTLFPAWEFLPSKTHPRTTPLTYNDVPIAKSYWDGFQAEYAVAPGTCCGWLGDRMRIGLKEVLAAARKVDKQAHFLTEPVVEIPPALLMQAEDEHVALGCDPSMNAYGREQVMVEDPRGLRHRFAGGHVHMGSPVLIAASPDELNRIVKAIDFVVGVASVGMYAGVDNPIRRQYYGRAGEFRRPAHGLEYRVLSNAWLMHPVLYHWTFDFVRGAVSFAHKGILDLITTHRPADEEIERIINEGDVRAARALVRTNADIYRVIAADFYGSEGPAADVTAYLIEHGVQSLLDVRKMEENWHLHGAAAPWKTHCGLPNCQFANFAATAQACIRMQHFDEAVACGAAS